MSALKICPQCGTEYELDQRFCPKDGSTLKTQGGENDLVGSIIADRYHVLRKLGEGGMGQVYLAEHVKMGRKSAVKVMNPGMVHDADAISRFNREAANASRINHPNVAAVYDFGETGDGLIYLAMEFVEGPSLSSVIEKMGSGLPPQRAAEITRQAGEALTIAHDMGIVHRDLKPDNIMIAKNRDGTDLVKVVDFGIAKAANNEAQKVTKTGLVVGTPEYMSPEQLAGDKLDGRSDIYSLALVAFNMLTGKLPFPSETAQEAMIMRLTDKPKSLAEMKPETSWPPEVEAVMERALERDASLRYQTASEFGRSLHAAVEKMPQSVVTEMGTQVMGAAAAPAVPATRVASAGDRAPAKGNNPAPVTPAGKSKVPLFAGVAAAVVLIGGGGAYFAMHGKGAAVPEAPVSKTATDTTHAPGVKPEPLRQELGSSQAKPGGPPPPTVPKTPSGGAVDLDAKLNKIKSLVDDSTTAAGALTQLDDLKKELAVASTEQAAQAALYKLRAMGSLNDGAALCSYLPTAMDVGKKTTSEKPIDAFTEFCKH